MGSISMVSLVLPPLLHRAGQKNPTFESGSPTPVKREEKQATRRVCCVGVGVGNSWNWKTTSNPPSTGTPRRLPYLLLRRPSLTLDIVVISSSSFTVVVHQSAHIHRPTSFLWKQTRSSKQLWVPLRQQQSTSLTLLYSRRPSPRRRVNPETPKEAARRPNRRAVMPPSVGTTLRVRWSRRHI